MIDFFMSPTTLLLWSSRCVALLYVLYFYSVAHPDLPEGKATIAQNLIAYY
jgi:hypothetical protein